MVPSRPSVVTWSGTFDKCSGAINICSVLVCVPCMCTCMVLSRPSVDTWSGTFDKCSGAINICSVLVCVPCMCTCMVLSRPSVDTWSGTFDKCPLEVIPQPLVSPSASRTLVKSAILCMGVNEIICEAVLQSHLYVVVEM